VSPKKRFSYLKNDNDEQNTSNDTPDTTSSAAPNSSPDVSPISQTESLRSVPRGEGRMAQPREQLNVRIPTMLKRKAVAKATLEGRTIGDVIEALLAGYVDEPEEP